MSRVRASKLPSYRLQKSSGQAVVTLNGLDFYLGKQDTPATPRDGDLMRNVQHCDFGDR